jgi:hypothetical protein
VIRKIAMPFDLARLNRSSVGWIAVPTWFCASFREFVPNVKLSASIAV